jgi:hypothetical protein
MRTRSCLWAALTLAVCARPVGARDEPAVPVWLEPPKPPSQFTVPPDLAGPRTPAFRLPPEDPSPLAKWEAWWDRVYVWLAVLGGLIWLSRLASLLPKENPPDPPGRS